MPAILASKEGLAFLRRLSQEDWNLEGTLSRPCFRKRKHLFEGVVGSISSTGGGGRGSINKKDTMMSISKRQLILACQFSPNYLDTVNPVKIPGSLCMPSVTMWQNEPNIYLEMQRINISQDNFKEVKAEEYIVLEI